MKPALLDVNVLVALAWPNHVHHDLALAWFEKHSGSGWATGPVTQSGFVRVSSNRRVMPEAKTPAEALLLLERIVSLPDHRFWEDDTSLVESQTIAREKLVGHRQVTDAHLLALAIRHGGRLATLDAGIERITPQGFEAKDVIALIQDSP